ncbi:MAG: hypothetical protein ACK5WS_06285 [Alphaproteobacteria bacterium]|jgi:hypothetical protein
MSDINLNPSEEVVPMLPVEETVPVETQAELVAEEATVSAE